jgi:hypothetical protein
MTDLPDAAPAKPSTKLSVLDDLRIASPCTESWAAMKGDAHVRRCDSCEKNVFDLSSLTRADAEALLLRTEGLCIRLYRRFDGTVLTADCPVGVRLLHQATRGAARMSWFVVGAALLLISGGLFGWNYFDRCLPSGDRITNGHSMGAP